MWEYMVINESTVQTEKLSLLLNARGSLGWEVCGFASADPTMGVNQLVAMLKRQVTPWPSPPAPAPDWHPDPTGRYEQRFWDGLHWSQHVSTNGQTDVDYPNRRST